jgi:hypothetical protein
MHRRTKKVHVKMDLFLNNLDMQCQRVNEPLLWITCVNQGVASISGAHNFFFDPPEPGSRRVEQTHVREVGAKELAGPGQFRAVRSQWIGPELYPIVDKVTGSVVAAQVDQVLESHLVSPGEVRPLDQFLYPLPLKNTMAGIFAGQIEGGSSERFTVLQFPGF